MADKLLNQADVDALIASMTQSKPEERISVPAPTVPGYSQKIEKISLAKPPVEDDMMPKTATRRPVPTPKVSPAATSGDSLNKLNTKIANLEKQLSQIGGAIKQLEALESKMAALEAKMAQNQQSAAVTKQVQLITQQVQKITVNLQNTPGYGIRNNFTCEKCESGGTVATVFRCTKCGKEIWRGWWPKK